MYTFQLRLFFKIATLYLTILTSYLPIAYCFVIVTLYVSVLTLFLLIGSVLLTNLIFAYIFL